MAKSNIEERKLSLEIADLERRWYQRPQVWLAAAAAVASVIGVIGQSILTNIKAERALFRVEKAVEKEAKLRKSIADLEDQRAILVKGIRNFDSTDPAAVSKLKFSAASVQLKAVLSAHTGLPQAEISLFSDLREDLLLSEASLRGLAVPLEKEFGISITQSDLSNVRTVRDLARILTDGRP